MSKKVRTRFAPSPTGYMHIGNLRTALYEYLVARSYDGQFILRIEDTDRSRHVEGAVDAIFKSLELAGIKHDEGPDTGGEYGPYVQSQRKDIYIKHAWELVNTGKAYCCFCSLKRLEQLKKKHQEEGITHRYDGRCISLSESEVKNRIDSGEQYVIRQKMPRTGSTSFMDTVFGKITINNSELDDQILIKSDKMPTYNFANVVDDHLMRITHVVRGSEYLTSTPKYNLLYNAFGWDVPVYIHLPLINRKDGGKLSKRAGDPSFEDLVSMGYLPEAVVNYVALLGWSPGDEREFFTLSELEKAFDIKGISKSPAVFDIEKLKWMNGEYIRKKTSGEFFMLSHPYILESVKSESIDLKKLSGLLHKRTEVLSEIPENTDFIESMPDYELSLFRHKRMKTDEKTSFESLNAALEELKQLKKWEADAIHKSMLGLAQRLGIKNGQLLWPLRIAISGKKVTPGGAIEIADILGRHETINRLQKSIDRLKEA